MFGKKKLLEERIDAGIRAEFVGLITELESNLRDYRRRSRRKEEARAELERAEAEARRIQLERIESKKRFWEAYYGENESILPKIELEYRSLERAMKKAERSLKRAHAHFEKADFDEVAEGDMLKERADAAEEKVDLRISALEQAIEELFAEIWRDVKEISGDVRNECQRPHSATSEEEIAHRESA
jgi:hypothetical protein